MKAEDLRNAVIKAIDSVSVPEELISIGIDYVKYSDFCAVSVYFHKSVDSVSYRFEFGASNRTTIWEEDTSEITDISREQALEEVKARFEALGGEFNANNI